MLTVSRLPGWSPGLVALLAAFACLSTNAEARKRSEPAGDAFDAIGHIALSADSASRLLTTGHGRRDYLYIELSSRPVLLRIDVTDAAKPRILGELPLSRTAGAHLDTVVGDAVMLTDAGPAPVRIPRSVQLMSFADPSHPKLVREFVNVTGFLKDDARGLVYLFNDTGLWILQQRSGPDLELLEQYQREVFYNR